jgi:hypothetical protein
MKGNATHEKSVRAEGRKKENQVVIMASARPPSYARKPKTWPAKAA